MERKSATDPLGWGTEPSDMFHAIVVRQRVHSDAIEAGHRAPPHFAGVNQLPAGRCALAPLLTCRSSWRRRGGLARRVPLGAQGRPTGVDGFNAAQQPGRPRG